jgi:signal transduction histidine kinase
VCDVQIVSSVIQTDDAAVETLANADGRVVSTQDRSATAGQRPSAGGLTGFDARELRHELRNALTAAAGYAQWLGRRSTSWADERERRALEAIRQGIERAWHLLQDDWGHTHGPHLELRQLVAEAVSQGPPLRIGDVVIRILAEEPLVGRWDSEQIVEVLVNLLDNAVKYSPPGTPIVVEIGREADRARITVRDRGIGIDDKDVAVIFDGHRTELARTVAEGSGIGLRLSRRLVHAEGGRIGVTSQPGSGSAFWGTLPLATESTTAT